MDIFRLGRWSLIGLFAVAALMAAPAAQAAGLLRVGVQLEPPNLDPTSGAAAAIDEIVYANVFEGLTRIVEDGGVAPALATTWTVSENGTVYDFTLRRNVTFHDGSFFDANDVVFSFTRAALPGSTNAQRPLFALIDTVEALAPDRVRITLNEPVSEFLTYLGWGDFVIVAEESAAANATHPVGSGPFKFERWRKGASVLLSRNERYWGARAALDGVEFVFVPDPTAAYAALMAGDVDGFPNYPAAENLPLIERNSRFSILAGSGEGETILAINNAKAPFNDLRVRRALSHAIDKKALIETALFGFGQPIGSHFSPRHEAYEDLTGRYPYDPAKARALLAEAGYPAGFYTTLALPPPAYARRSGEVIAAQLEAVGVKTDIRNLEWAQWLDQVFTNKNYDLTIVSHTEPLDIDIYARDDYYFQYSNDAFKNIISTIRSEPNADARNELYREAQRLLADDAVNVFLAQGSKIGVWRRGVSGVWANAPLQANDFTSADIAGRTAWAPQSVRAPSTLHGALFAFIFAVTLLALIIFARVDLAFVLSRSVAAIVTLIAATLLIFLLIEVVPGDPAVFMMGLNADPHSVAALRSELGLDQPVLHRYFNWLSAVFTGDFGVSYTYRIPVAELITERLWVTLPLALLAFALAAAAGIPAGVAAAGKRGSRMARLLEFGAQAGIAAPNFWLAILLVMVFAISLNWFPAGGFPGWRGGFFLALKSLLLPAIALAVPQAAILAQTTRSAMIDTLRADFIRTARAKGASERDILWRHAFRNALVPILTILGLQFSFLVAGSVIVENVFYLPGLGRLVFQAIAQRDLIVVESVALLLVFIVVTASLIIDLSYAIADPRLRRRSGG